MPRPVEDAEARLVMDAAKCAQRRRVGRCRTCRTRPRVQDDIACVNLFQANSLTIRAQPPSLRFRHTYIAIEFLGAILACVCCCTAKTVSGCSFALRVCLCIAKKGFQVRFRPSCVSMHSKLLTALKKFALHTLSTFWDLQCLFFYMASDLGLCKTPRTARFGLDSKQAFRAARLARFSCETLCTDTHEGWNCTKMT